MDIELDEVTIWLKRVVAAEAVHKAWQEDCRVAECYQYWKGNQRDEPMDGPDRKAQHNKIHPDVAEQTASLYLNDPFGRVIAIPGRADTPGETVSEKARLLQDTGAYLVRDPGTGFRENTDNAAKEAWWAMGVVEVGYSPNFIDNPLSQKPALKEKEDTKTGEVDLAASATEGMLKDEFGLTVDDGSDLESLTKKLSVLRSNLKSETFFVKHIPAGQVLISPTDKPILENNDWVGYWEEYPLEDIKRSPAYQNTEDLKADADRQANAADGSVDRVRLYRVWDFRTKQKLVFARNTKKLLMKMPFERCGLKFLRMDVDPYHFYPIPPIFLKLASQDAYNDSAEYLRKMRIGTVPRYTYDEDAVDSEQAAKLQSRDMNVTIPRKGGTRQPIEAINQPNTSATAVQTLALSEREFAAAGISGGDPLKPDNQTATRAVIANARKTAQEGYTRGRMADWLAEVIQELILTAIDNINLPTIIAMNVDLDSPFAMQDAVMVGQTWQQIDAEKLRDANLGIHWYVDVEPEALSPVSESERGAKLMQVVTFMSNPAVAALLSSAPKLLKMMLRLGGVTVGEDVDAIMQGLQAIVQMNMMAAQKGAGGTPGISPQAGQEAGPVHAVAPPPEPMPVPQGLAGAQ